jgi:hypothetical protein
LFLASASFALGSCGPRDKPASTETRVFSKAFALSEPAVENGVTLDRKSAPRTYPRIIVTAEPGWGELCTMTAVGPRVLLTAAHCIFGKNSPKQAVTVIKLDGTNSSIDCQHLPDLRSFRSVNGKWAVDPGAPQDPSADIALCMVMTKRSDGQYLSGNAKFERIDTRDENDWLMQRVVIAGFGPSESDGHTSPDMLTAGDAIVQQSSTQPKEPRVDEGAVYADCSDATRLRCSKHMLIISGKPTGGSGLPQLLGGDSGGAVFNTGGPMIKIDGVFRLPEVRRIIGVNARGAFQDGYSFIAAVGNKRFRDWAVAWAASQGKPSAPLAICGVNTKDSDTRCNPASFPGPTH